MPSLTEQLRKVDTLLPGTLRAVSRLRLLIEHRPLPDNALRILLVEDDAVIGLSLQMLLEANGYIVTGPIGNGIEALEIADRSSIDIALLDLKLSGSVNGLTVGRALRERSIPIVFLTGHVSAFVSEALGLTRHIIRKPYADADLLAALREAVLAKSVNPAR